MNARVPGEQEQKRKRLGLYASIQKGSGWGPGPETPPVLQNIILSAPPEPRLLSTKLSRIGEMIRGRTGVLD